MQLFITFKRILFCVVFINILAQVSAKHRPTLFRCTLTRSPFHRRQTTRVCMQLILNDLDVNPMTLILKLGLYITEIYLCAKMNFVYQSIQKLEPKQVTHILHLFCSCDLDLMTFIYKLYLDIPKTQRLSKMKFLNQGFQKLKSEQDRQTSHIHRRD